MRQYMEQLYNYILTKKTINGRTIYDELEGIINDSIQYIKEVQLNAKITNLMLAVDGKLVPVQIYVERKNGYAPTQNVAYGTSPTAYNVQLRFPYGLNTDIEGRPVYLPAGEFTGIQAYKRPVAPGDIVDEVQRDVSAEAVVCGNGVEKKITGVEKEITGAVGLQQLTFKALEVADEVITIPIPFYRTVKNGFCIMGNDYTEFGYNPVKYEYTKLKAHESRYGMTDVYSVWYSPIKEMLQQHPNVRFRNVADDILLPVGSYTDYINQTLDSLLSTAPGQRWKDNLESKKVAAATGYILNLMVVNGTIIFADTRSPLVRLRDYQLGALERFHHMVHQVLRLESKVEAKSGIFAMGVGAGKTFLIFRMLQDLKRLMHDERIPFAPAFTMAPTAAIAQVMAKAITQQGSSTGESAVVVTSERQMPTDELMDVYVGLSKVAAKDAKEVDVFINEGLQRFILERAEKAGLSPFFIPNYHYSRDKVIGHWQSSDYQVIEKYYLKLFKDSIDIKRLLLLIEGQKLFMAQTGMLGIHALHNLLEQFNMIVESINAEKLNELRGDAAAAAKCFPEIVIDFNKAIEFQKSMLKIPGFTSINLAKMSEKQFSLLTRIRYMRGGVDNLSAQRNLLIRIAYLRDPEAAVLLANSGGLGNTNSPEQLTAQIAKFTPITFAAVTDLTKKDKLNHLEHLVLRSYLQELFSSVPDEINFYRKVKKEGAFKAHLYAQVVDANIKLVIAIRDKIQQQINSLTKAQDVVGITKLLQDIPANTTAIVAVDALVGRVILRLTPAADDMIAAKALLSHTPVFTPEGFATYIEQLAGLLDKRVTTLREECNVYTATKEATRVTRKDITRRLAQIFDAVMIADEVHEEAYSFLYDKKNLIYVRINEITRRHLGKEFCDVLPNRLGMTGTCNQVAREAFGATIYKLSIPEMIRRRLTKHVNVSQIPVRAAAAAAAAEAGVSYAEDIVVEYLSQVPTTAAAAPLDIIALSQGLIFTGKPAASKNLRAEINHCFAMLVAAAPNADDLPRVARMFKRINAARAVYNLPQLDSTSLRALQTTAYQNYLAAIYIEYVVSKSSIPKELSVIVGFQNRLFSRGVGLLDILQPKYKVPGDADDAEVIELRKQVRQLQSLMEEVDPRCITQEDVTTFISERIQGGDDHKDLRNMLISFFIDNKNAAGTKVDYANAADYLNKIGIFDVPGAVTYKQATLETGSVLAMLADEPQRTGYSHQPVGIVVDVPAHIDLIREINSQAGHLKGAEVTAEVLKGLLSNLYRLTKNTYSYAAKEQMGGRALRTPHGCVSYVECVTGVNAAVTLRAEDRPLLQVLMVESSFADIFTADATHATTMQQAITFNREAINLLHTREHVNCTKYILEVWNEFARDFFAIELQAAGTATECRQAIVTKLTFLWAMHNEPARVVAYMKTGDFAADYFNKVLPAIPNALAAATGTNENQGGGGLPGGDGRLILNQNVHSGQVGLFQQPKIQELKEPLIPNNGPDSLMNRNDYVSVTETETLESNSCCRCC